MNYFHNCIHFDRTPVNMNCKRRNIGIILYTFIMMLMRVYMFEQTNVICNILEQLTIAVTIWFLYTVLHLLRYIIITSIIIIWILMFQWILCVCYCYYVELYLNYMCYYTHNYTRWWSNIVRSDDTDAVWLLFYKIGAILLSIYWFV